MSGTRKRGIIKKSYFCFNFMTEILLFHTSCYFIAMFTYLGFPEACTVCLSGIVAICVPVAHLTCVLELHLQEWERSYAGLGPDSLGLFSCYWQ